MVIYENIRESVVNISPIVERYYDVIKINLMRSDNFQLEENFATQERVLGYATDLQNHWNYLMTQRNLNNLTVKNIPSFLCFFRLYSLDRILMKLKSKVTAYSSMKYWRKSKIQGITLGSSTSLSLWVFRHLYMWYIQRSAPFEFRTSETFLCFMSMSFLPPR